MLSKFELFTQALSILITVSPFENLGNGAPENIKQIAAKQKCRHTERKPDKNKSQMHDAPEKKQRQKQHNKKTDSEAFHNSAIRF